MEILHLRQVSFFFFFLNPFFPPLSSSLLPDSTCRTFYPMQRKQFTWMMTLLFKVPVKFHEHFVCVTRLVTTVKRNVFDHRRHPGTFWHESEAWPCCRFFRWLRLCIFEGHRSRSRKPGMWSVIQISFYDDKFQWSCMKLSRKVTWMGKSVIIFGTRQVNHKVPRFGCQET